MQKFVKILLKFDKILTRFEKDPARGEAHAPALARCPGGARFADAAFAAPARIAVLASPDDRPRGEGGVKFESQHTFLP